MAFTLLLLARSSSACRFVAASIPTRYYRALNADTPLSLATVLRSNVPPGGGYPPADPVYHLNVTQVYTGCAPKTPFVAVVKSGTDSCGVWDLRTGQKYLLPINLDGDTRISLFDQIVLQSEITKKGQKFLDERDLCCKGQCRCAAAQRSACLVSPCSVARPKCPVDKCVDNFCGGCKAEFFKDGLPACEN